MGTQLPQKGHSPQFSAHVYCGQTVAHLSYTAELLLRYVSGQVYRHPIAILRATTWDEVTSDVRALGRSESLYGPQRGKGNDILSTCDGGVVVVAVIDEIILGRRLRLGVSIS